MNLWTKTMHLPLLLGRWCQPGLLLQQDWTKGGIFHCPKPTNWVLTFMYIPIAATTSDGAHMWQNSLDDWENKLLQDVQVLELIHMIMENIQQSSFLVATDGSFGTDSMLFGWKITTKTGDPLAMHASPAFGNSSSFCLEAYGILL
eukprot:15343134-Ditylum_brightwellii.AAC.1